MYACSKCDAQSPKWAGRCSECGAWGTLAEEGATASPTFARAPSPTSAKKSPKSSSRTRANATSAPLSVARGAGNATRHSTGIAEVDRVLGGGLVQGSLVLLAGEPGIGKSTLVASLAGAMARAKARVLYVSGEESAAQLAGRFERLEVDLATVHVLEPFPVETIVETIEREKPTLAIIDSVQTIGSEVMEGAPGTPTLVRYTTSVLLDCAKRTGTCILLIGQVTKDGSVAGPKTLEHLVDAVLALEGDPVHAYRLLRSTKNRFGSTNEVGVFEMSEQGLIAVENPSARFLAERVSVPGSVIAASIEGSRVFLVEVQALVEKAGYGTPVRRASGFDQNRLQMLCAILSKRLGLKLNESDVFVNVIGGLSLNEPAADLAVCAAIVSAHRNHADAHPVVYAGEVGLGGEVRSVPFLERRLTEAKRLGITHAMIPGSANVSVDGLTVTQVRSVAELT